MPLQSPLVGNYILSKRSVRRMHIRAGQRSKTPPFHGRSFFIREGCSRTPAGRPSRFRAGYATGLRCTNKKDRPVTDGLLSFGRGDWIRTSDHLHPMQVRYRAALHPEWAAKISDADQSRGRSACTVASCKATGAPKRRPLVRSRPRNRAERNRRWPDRPPGSSDPGNTCVPWCSWVVCFGWHKDPLPLRRQGSRNINLHSSFC